MKKTFLILILAFITSQTFAQIDDIKLNDLSVPTSPAFNILDVEPKSINRPTTPKALLTSVASGLDADGKLSDFAIEFAPYWLNPKRDLSFTDYINKPTMYQNLSISIGTREFNDSLFVGRKLGIGFKTILYNSKNGISTDLENKIAEIKTENLKGSFLLTLASADLNASNYNEKVKEAYKNFANGLNATDKDIFLKTQASEYAELIKNAPFGDRIKMFTFLADVADKNFLKTETAKGLQDLMHSRVGFMIELAGATSLKFSDSNIRNDGEVDKTGVWAIATQRSKNQAFEMSLMTRWIWARGDSTTSNYDIGLSASYNQKKYALSLEGIFRDQKTQFDDANTPDTHTSTYKVALNIEYKLTDEVHVTATFGKNYDEPLTAESNLLALLGLSLGLPGKVSNPF